jgi:hypothetical protein
VSDPFPLQAQAVAGNIGAYRYRMYLSGRGPSPEWDMQFGTDVTQGVFKMDFYWADAFYDIASSVGAIGAILGWNFQIGGPSTGSPGNNTATTQLSRQLPMRHPAYPTMFAREIVKAEGVKFTGKQAFRYGPFAGYQWARLAVRFWVPPYAILSDFQCANKEYNRWTVWTPKPADTVFTCERGLHKWAAGGTYTGPLQQGIGLPISRDIFEWKWYDVPHVGLFDSKGNPTNLYSVRNKVNSVTFWGKNPGTLLFEQPTLEPRVAPVSPVWLNQVATDVPRYWNVTIRAIYHEPPGGDGTWQKSGHNLSTQNGRDWQGIVSNDTNLPPFDSVDPAVAWQMNTT